MEYSFNRVRKCFILPGCLGPVLLLLLLLLLLGEDELVRELVVLLVVVLVVVLDVVLDVVLVGMFVIGTIGVTIRPIFLVS